MINSWEVDYVNGKTRIFGIVGHPIEQVRSPEMITAELVSRGLNSLMVPVHVLPADFDRVMPELLKLQNFDGFVFTIPFKGEARRFASQLGPQASFVGAVNALVRTDDGNILWDCIATLDDATVTMIKGLGGVDAIAISHPHFYTTMVEWAHAFTAPIHLHAADKQWIMRGDPSIALWDGETKTLWNGVTLVRCGGHFEGGTVLHLAGGAGGRGIVCAGDILTVTTDRKWLTFMRSYPNFIPLSARTVEHIGAALKPFAFETIYGHYFDRVIANDAKTALEVSVMRYVAAVEGKRGY